MKKRLVLLTVLVCASLGVLVRAALSLTAQLKRVEVTETVLLGDTKAAEGFHLTEKIGIDEGRSQWDIHFTPGHTDEAESVFRPNTGWMEWWSTVEPDFNLEVPEGIGIASTDSVPGWSRQDRFYEVFSSDTMAPYWKELEEKGTMNCTVHLADFYEQFPIEWWENTGYYTYQSWEYQFFLEEQGNVNSEDEQELLQEYRKMDEAIHRFFYFPVLPEDTLTIEATSDPINGFNMNASSNRSWSLSTMSATSKWGCFFAFNGENEVDFSHVPGGFGLYYVPFDLMPVEVTYTNEDGEEVMENSQEVERVRFDRLQTAYSLEGYTPLSMAASEDEEHIYLVARNETGCFLLEFDGKDGSLVSSISLTDGGEYVGSMICQEDFIVIHWSSCQIALLTRTENRWKEEFCYRLPREEELGNLQERIPGFRWGDWQSFYCSDRSKYCWDGQRLALFCGEVGKALGLLVLSADGVECLSIYKLSLDPPELGEQYYYDTGSSYMAQVAMSIKTS